jgi:hypothetical protein
MDTESIDERRIRRNHGLFQIEKVSFLFCKIVMCHFELLHRTNMFAIVYSVQSSVYWDYAINIDLNSIVYLHCHQQTNRGSVVILVGQDGVQYPPICFPKGSHLLQFLTCLENGLAPDACLDPPLSLQDNMAERTFPKVKASKANDLNNNTEAHDFEPKDFVFRIRTKISEGKRTKKNRLRKINFEFDFSLNSQIKTRRTVTYFGKFTIRKIL